MKIPKSEISLRLNLHRSTIYRELKRNREPNGTYRPELADRNAKIRRKSCARKAVLLERSRYQVLSRELSRDLSPEQIAHRFKIASHQTIYRSISKLYPELKVHLRRFGKRRGRGRPGRRPQRSLPEWYKPISLRPESVLDRQTLGHWERDTMYIKDRRQLLVAVERKSRFVRIAKVEHPYFTCIASKTAKLIDIKNVPPMTITNDRGGEFRGRTNIKTPIYFCDPQSPQQRGTIENTIGFLRQYLPLGTDINQLTRYDIKKIEHRMNNRPRKCLNYRTPYEVMFDLPVALAT